MALEELYEPAPEIAERRRVFFHRIQEGGTDRSYGIHVARLAGLPQAVVERSRALIAGLSGRTEGLGAVGFAAPAPQAPPSRQLSLFPPPGEDVRQELMRIDPERITPFEALDLLRRLVLLSMGSYRGAIRKIRSRSCRVARKKSNPS